MDGWFGNMETGESISLVRFEVGKEYGKQFDNGSFRLKIEREDIVAGQRYLTYTLTQYGEVIEHGKNHKTVLRTDYCGSTLYLEESLPCIGISPMDGVE